MLQCLETPRCSERKYRVVLVLIFSLLTLVGTNGYGNEYPATPSVRPSPSSVDLIVHVVDPDGLPLPGTTVLLKLDGSKARTALTSRNGEVVFSRTPCNTAALIQVSFPGMVPVLLDDLVTCATSSDTVRLCLDEILEVIVLGPCRGPIVDIDKARTSTVFGGDFLADLPGSPGYSRRRAVRRSKRKLKECEARVVWLPTR